MSLNTDLDAKGTISTGAIAYGLPRFAAEGVQFDAALSVSDPDQRYLETMSYGLKAQTIWSKSFSLADAQYGAAWYTNTHRRYRVNGWPEIVAGPKIGFVRETRFMGFMPSEGYRISLMAIPSQLDSSQSIVESEIAGTWIPQRHLAITLDGQSLTTGNTGITVRGEGRFEIPITDNRAEGTKAIMFLKLREGEDRYQDIATRGSDAILGIRYHSPGFIGELAFQITQVTTTNKPNLPVSGLRSGGL